MLKLSDKILDFYENVHLGEPLPNGIKIMNPYKESEDIRVLCNQFYKKYYHDQNLRFLILGINPGRLGAGSTGIPFTDTKRLNEFCGISYQKFSSHEPSSVFIYDMIMAYGGPTHFYQKFYINSICPLGFVLEKQNQKAVNYNYYDSVQLEEAVRPFILKNIEKQIALCGHNEVCFCLGTGKNFAYLKKINAEYNFFKTIVPLEHPRYIMQYKLKEKDQYINNYLNSFETYTQI